MQGNHIEPVSKTLADFRELQSDYKKEMQAFMVEAMKPVMVDFGSTTANVIRQRCSQTSAPKALDELAEPSKSVLCHQSVLVKGWPWSGEELSTRPMPPCC